MIAAAFTLGVFWTFLQPAPITIYNPRVTTPEVIAGGQIAISIEITQHNECIFDARHLLVDSNGNIRELAPSYSIIPSDAELRSISFVFNLPNDLPLGESFIRSQFIAECNPLRKHITNVDYLGFEVK